MISILSPVGGLLLLGIWRMLPAIGTGIIVWCIVKLILGALRTTIAEGIMDARD